MKLYTNKLAVPRRPSASAICIEKGPERRPIEHQSLRSPSNDPQSPLLHITLRHVLLPAGGEVGVVPSGVRYPWSRSLWTRLPIW